MKPLQSMLIVLAWTISLLVITQTATAGGGKGPEGGPAAVAIDGVGFVNQNNGSTVAEISGGGFLNGDDPLVTLDDGTVLSVSEVSATMIVATISQQTADGDYTLMVSTGLWWDRLFVVER